MKKTFLTLLLFLFLKSAFSQELSFDVYGNHALPVTREQISKARTLSDINPGYPASWITEYVSSSVLVTSKGERVNAAGTNDVLNAEQKKILNSFDPGTDIHVEVKYRTRNAVTNEMVDRGMNFSVTVMPATEAEFLGGNKKMKEYLKETAINKIPVPFAEDLLARIRFVVDEEGTITNAHISRTSGDEKTDALLLEAINKMPKWKPAKDSNGVKVSQEFEFSVGNGGC